MKKDLLSILDLSAEEIQGLFDSAADLKLKHRNGEFHELLRGKVLGMLFMKSSTRTRVSFESGMFQLGGYGLFLSPGDLQLGRGETIPDTARVLSRYVDGIVIRTYDHQDVEELAKYSSIPIINGLTDLVHPCQVLADLFTLAERGLEKDFTIAYVGDGNNVANSWINAATRIPMSLNLGIPEGYDPDEEILWKARQKGISSIRVTRNPIEAVREADVIYTDVWASMGQEGEAEDRRKIFAQYKVDSRLVAAANDDVLVMHCLPAHRGEEITDDVIDGPRSIVFDQAENRMHLQKAILAELIA